MATSTGSRVQTGSLGTFEWLGIALAVVLGIAYFPLGTGALPESIGIAFLLAGVGYLGAVGLVLVGYRRRLVYAIGIAYNALLIVLYFLFQQPSLAEIEPFAGAIKIGQALFAVLLGVLLIRR